MVAYVDHVYPDKNKSFKMHVRRAKKTYPGTSMELNADLGGAILDAFPEMKVDVHNPQLLITVEIREKSIFTPSLFRDRAVCRSEPTEKRCFCYPVVLTLR